MAMVLHYITPLFRSYIKVTSWSSLYTSIQHGVGWLGWNLSHHTIWDLERQCLSLTILKTNQNQLPGCSVRGLGIIVPYIFKLPNVSFDTCISSFCTQMKKWLRVFLLFFFSSQPNTAFDQPSALIYWVGGGTKWGMVYLTELAVQHSKTPPPPRVKRYDYNTIIHTCSTKVHQAWRKLQGGKLHSIITVLKSLSGVMWF